MHETDETPMILQKTLLISYVVSALQFWH